MTTMVFNNCTAVPLRAVVEVVVETTVDVVVAVVLVSAAASPLAGASDVELIGLDATDAQPTENTNESAGNTNATERCTLRRLLMSQRSS